MRRVDPEPDTSSFTIQVFYEDTDASGVVYHANYLRYLERGRSLWLESLGFTHTRLAEELGVGFVVARADLRFKAPARLDDRVQVTVEISRVRHASLQFEQGIWRDSTLLVKAQFTVACVRLSTFAPCEMPDMLRSMGVKSKPKEHE